MAMSRICNAHTHACAKKNPKNCTDGTETLEKETQPHINNSIDLLSKGRLASELLWWGRSCTHIENHSGWWRQQGVYCYSYKPTAYMLHWPDKLKYGGASLRKTNARNKERALRCWRLSMHQLGCLLVAASPVYQTAISKKKKKRKKRKVTWAHKAGDSSKKRCKRTASCIKNDHQILN